MHLAVAAIVNGLWDLWAKLANKPLWRLLTDMEPEVKLQIILSHFKCIQPNELRCGKYFVWSYQYFLCSKTSL